MSILVDYSAFKDEEILAHLKNGDGWAMSVLYDRYSRLVFSLALRILNDRAGAEEVVQEVFVKVWRRARDFRTDRGKFSSWLTGIAHHHAIDELRRRRVRPSAAGDESAAAEVMDGQPSPTERAEQSMEHRIILNALESIPADQRRAIELAYFEGFTQQEIAEKLDEPLGTVKTRMRLGMQKLRVLLEGRKAI